MNLKTTAEDWINFRTTGWRKKEEAIAKWLKYKKKEE